MLGTGKHGILEKGFFNNVQDVDFRSSVFRLYITSLAYAACTSPPGSDESFEWDEATHTRTYCDGTTWKTLRELDDSGSGVRTRIQIADDAGACTAAKLGRLRYDGTSTWDYCDGSNWTRLGGLWAVGSGDDIYYNFGTPQVGISTATPEATLHVDGEAIIGNTGLGCSGTTERAIRYNSTQKNIEICNGTEWEKIYSSACDNAPAFLAFPSLTAQGTSTLVTSSILAVTGMDTGCTTNAGVSGTGGSPEYRTCSDASCSTELQTWTSANNTLDIQGNYIQLRATTSASTDTSFTITLDTGPTSSDWIITTGLTECAPIGSVCTDGTVYAGLSQGSIPMFVTRCDAGQTWGGSSCDGTRQTNSWNDGATDYTTTSVIDQADGKTNTASLITIDSNSVVAGTQPHAAAQYCSNLVLHGHSDWYLPAKNELNVMYGNRTVIANFDESGTHYWSSSEYSFNFAWRQRFSDGNQNSSGKENSYAVRCARR
jgi:hypothetical protein